MDFAFNFEEVNNTKNVVTLLTEILGIDFSDSETRRFSVVLFCWNGFDYYFYTENFMSSANNSTILRYLYLFLDSILIKLRIESLSY